MYGIDSDLRKRDRYSFLNVHQEPMCDTDRDRLSVRKPIRILIVKGLYLPVESDFRIDRNFLRIGIVLIFQLDFGNHGTDCKLLEKTVHIHAD